MFILILAYFILQIPLYQGKCSISNCSICDSDEKCLKCKNGWFGKICKHVCLADNSTCSFCTDYQNIENGSDLSMCLGCHENEYVSTDGCKRCPDTCVSCDGTVNCTKCKDGFSGPTCQGVCPVNCQKCSAADLCSSCKDGWSGIKCQTKCSKHCLQYKKATSDHFWHVQLAIGEFDWCDENGTCLAGCVAGKYGRTCNKDCQKKNVCLACSQDTGHCLKCINGMYGQSHCNKRCGHCKLDNQGLLNCDINTGDCKYGCLDGYYNSSCANKCGHCQQDDSDVVKCDMVTGYCEYGCINGYFGRRCDKRCGHCLPDKNGELMCFVETGNCKTACIDGYYDYTCDKICNNNCFDSKRNTVRCDQITGKCSYGCVSGLYGALCEETCSKTCENSSCNQQSGYCDNGCTAGWHGNTCNNTCSCTCFNKSCNRLSGYCDNGCKPGWYGNNCKLTCSSTCSNKSCDWYSGNCNECVFGYYGNACEFSCPETCRRNACDSESAKCLWGCMPGFEGDFCNNSLEMNDSRLFVVGFTGCLMGLTVSFIFVLVRWLITRVICRGQRYGDLDLSTRENAAPIYEEISEIIERTEDQRITGSHLYMEVGNAPVVLIVQDSGTNTDMTGHYDIPAKRADIQSKDLNIVVTSTNLANENNETVLTHLKDKDSPTHESGNIERNNNRTDTVQSSNSNCPVKIEVPRANSNQSRKYYEIPDIPPMQMSSQADVKHIHDGYEVPISGKSESGQNDEDQKVKCAKQPTVNREIPALLLTKVTGSSLKTDNYERSKLNTTETEMTQNKVEDTTDTFDKIRTHEKKTNSAIYVNEKLEVNTRTEGNTGIEVKKTGSSEVSKRISIENPKFPEENREQSLMNPETAESNESNYMPYINMELHTSHIKESKMEPDNDSVTYLHPVC